MLIFVLLEWFTVRTKQRFGAAVYLIGFVMLWCLGRSSFFCSCATYLLSLLLAF